MKKTQLQRFAIDLMQKNVEIYIKDLTIPEWQPQYNVATKDIECNTIYGICIDGYIEYDFKTGKRYDNILKTFVTQYINKYAVKQATGWNTEICGFEYPNKKDVVNKLKNNNRISKYYFYTTLYGIGYFCYFMSKKAHESSKKMLSDYLNSNKITFENEFSEAGWVYRFLINKDVKIHNELLENFNID